jgi:LasA protease
VALQYLASQFYRPQEWEQVLYDPGRLMVLYREMFGDPWERAEAHDPILPASLLQPTMELPFQFGERWSFTGGPHKSWTTGTPLGALDFAPVTGEPACAVSRVPTTASAAGLVVRSERSLVVIDLDGDGSEHTGWVLVYMHVADRNRVPVGTWLRVDDPIGHPSCEGGETTGTHVHIARKYNGEWIAADGPLPFVLSGWRAHNGARPYEGMLTNGDQVVTARPDGSRTTSISR